MSGPWRIEMLAGGSGLIAHRAAPRFRALWTTGLEDLAALPGPCWTDGGRAEEDAISLYAFQWDDPAPGQDVFEGLMREAVLQIDTWIARRL